MKQRTWLIVLAVAIAVPLLSALAQTPAPPSPPPLSPNAAEVLKLAQSGTSDDILLAYVQNSPSPFNLAADQILYLKDVGVSSQVMTAMLNRDAALHAQPQQYAPSAPPPAAAPVPTAPPAPAPVPQAPPSYVGTPPPDVTYFYEDLSPYGSWADMPGYGWCWQPTTVVINRGWRPYCDGGHWMWTDAGWFWASDYSWGWAPFHYGRWFQHPTCGWAWAPDRVWGPAWVTWRTSGDICGWAPLPPHAGFDAHLGWSFNGVRVGLNFDFGLRADHFNFIAMRDFCDRDLGHRRLPPAEVTRVYNKTTVINNYVVQNNTIVNQGIKVERVAAATHTEIRRAAIRDLPAGSPRVTRVTGSERTGAVVYRPQLRAPTKSVNMVAQKVDQQHPVIQHREIAPARIERSPATSPAPAPFQPATRTTPRSTTERPAPSRPDYSAPKARSSALSAPASPAATRRVEATPPPTHLVASPPPTHPAVVSQAARPVADQPKPASRAVPVTSTPTYPLRTTQAAPSQMGQAGSQGQNLHIYYPKSYHQAADVHALPPMNSPPRTPTSSSSDRSSASRSRKAD